MSYPELPYVAFIAAFLVLIPLPGHWRARNVATLALIFWTFVVDIIYGVDAVLWQHNVTIQAVVWCDITTRLIIGGAMALPAACMCISIHLAQVASANHVGNTEAEKRRRRLIQLTLCFGVPLLWMALHYTVQGHRFDIIEDFGCRPNTYISVPGILLVWVPPLIFSAITIVYSAIALMHFLRHRLTFARLLANSNSGLTTSRYLRLMAMAFAEIVITAVSASINAWFASRSVRPWTNWADVHWDFLRIDTYPAAFIPPLAANFYYATWYTVPFASLTFFAFFAFGQDAWKEYHGYVSWVRRRIQCGGARKTAPIQNVKSFASLGSSSSSVDDYNVTLPSYMSSIGGDDAAPMHVEKADKEKETVDNKECYVAQHISQPGVEPAYPSHSPTIYGDYSPAAPLSTTTPNYSYPDLSPTPTHTHFTPDPHDLV